MWTPTRARNARATTIHACKHAFTLATHPSAGLAPSRDSDAISAVAAASRPSSSPLFPMTAPASLAGSAEPAALFASAEPELDAPSATDTAVCTAGAFGPAVPSSLPSVSSSLGSGFCRLGGTGSVHIRTHVKVPPTPRVLGCPCYHSSFEMLRVRRALRCPILAAHSWPSLAKQVNAPECAGPLGGPYGQQRGPFGQRRKRGAPLKR